MGPPRCDPLHRSWRVLTIWQLASRESVILESQSGRSDPFYDLAEKVMWHHFLHISFNRSESLNPGHRESICFYLLKGSISENSQTYFETTIEGIEVQPLCCTHTSGFSQSEQGEKGAHQGESWHEFSEPKQDEEDKWRDRLVWGVRGEVI